MFKSNPCNKLLSFIKYNCPLCQQPANTPICSSCSSTLPDIKAQCFQCGLPLETTENGCVLCGQCLQKPPHFDLCISPYHYKEPLNQFITQLKFHNKLYYANILASLLIRKIELLQDNLPECIIPVPLHSGRLRQRGFNQALEIARPIAKKYKIKLDTQSCKRVVATTSQMTQDKSARKENIRHAFKVKSPFPYQHIAIVDDVMTTGNTVNELARVLRSAGAIRIQIWTPARS